MTDLKVEEKLKVDEKPKVEEKPKIDWPVKTREFQNHHFDSTKWNDFKVVCFVRLNSLGSGLVFVCKYQSSEMMILLYRRLQNRARHGCSRSSVSWFTTAIRTSIRQRCRLGSICACRRKRWRGAISRRRSIDVSWRRICQSMRSYSRRRSSTFISAVTEETSACRSSTIISKLTTYQNHGDLLPVSKSDNCIFLHLVVVSVAEWYARSCRSASRSSLDNQVKKGVRLFDEIVFFSVSTKM